MNPETLEALKGSIEKWRKIVEEGAHNRGAMDCPLCDLFMKSHDCDGCPVREFSGVRYCRRTPYPTYMNMAAAHGHGSDEALTAARAELEFLRSLLPKEEAAE